MTKKAHYAVVAGELAPGARLSDEKYSRIPDLIRASFQAVNRLAPDQGKLKYQFNRKKGDKQHVAIKGHF
mgnify:CR=1 FL=1